MKQSLPEKDQFCLEAINDAIDKILEYTIGYSSADEFNDAYRDFDATMMNFVVIGEMVEKISDDFKRKHSNIDWIKI